MQRIRRMLPLALGLIVVGAAGARAADTPDQKAVRDRVAGLVKAISAHDLKAIQGFYAPSFVQQSKDGSKKDYKAMMASLGGMIKAAPTLKFAATPSSIAVKGDTATVARNWTVSMTNPPVNEKGKDVQTWKKLKGQWMLVGEKDV